MKNIIFVPGLGDSNSLLNWLVKRFEKDEFVVFIHPAPWESKSESFKEKLKRLVSVIDELKGEVYLFGISAGGSLVLNAYLQRKSQITGVVNLFGRLKSSGVPSLNLAAKDYAAFKESVLTFEKLEPTLTSSDRKKILTMKALFDEIVPVSTMSLRDSTNLQIPTIEHNLSIFIGLLFYKRPYLTS